MRANFQITCHHESIGSAVAQYNSTSQTYFSLAPNGLQKTPVIRTTNFSIYKGFAESLSSNVEVSVKVPQSPSIKPGRHFLQPPREQLPSIITRTSIQSICRISNQ